jgi:hypothetical protein
MTKNFSLNKQQEKLLDAHVKAFQAYVESTEFQSDQAQRLEHVHFFQSELPKRLPELSEADITEIVTRLWASRIWGNKQYHVQTIIADNGLDKLKTELERLFDQSQSPGERYERFLQQVKRLGPASVTEILCYIDPAHCGIWNRKARRAIEILKLESYIDPRKYRLSGLEYEGFNALLQEIARCLRQYGFQTVDLLFVDFFLYDIAETKQPQRESEKPEEFDHDEIRDLIESIGEMLGFESQTEQRIAHGAQVDAVWRARIGNLGIVTYVFEVHKSGSIDSLLLNLYKAKSNPTVQKVIAVSDEKQLEKIKREADALPEEFRKALVFWPISQVQEVSEKLQRVNEIIDQLALVQGEFPIG